MSEEKNAGKKKKGPKGGVKHTPGRGHAPKSGSQKKKRFQRKSVEKRRARQRDLQKGWDEWDALPPEVKKLRSDMKPTEPRPKNENELKTPRGRRKFSGGWDEVRYVYDKLLYWLYQREDARRARLYAERLARLLPRVAPDRGAIFGEECWSLVYETRGNLPKAIEHRENEIRLIRRLHEIARKSTQSDPALRDYGHADLSDRLDLLAVLYHDAGDLERALSLLHESKALCEAHHLKFDGDDLLREYSDELQSPGSPDLPPHTNKPREPRRKAI